MPRRITTSATSCLARDELDEAIASFERALAIRPEYPEAHNSLGNTLSGQGRLDEAVASFERALALSPQYAEAHGNLGNALKSMGRHDEALDCYRQACRLAPARADLHSNLIFSLHFHPGYDAKAIHGEHAEWERRHGEPRQRFQQPHTNMPDPTRRLKIGYVSPDLREHPIGHLLLPVLLCHDHEQYQITCYAEVAQPDVISERLRAKADLWRDTSGSTEEALAELVREDGIDILVDLALHTGGNRLTMFAHKPAPVQVSFAGYPGTTGLSAIDYRISDRFLDPPGQTASHPDTGIIRLPDSFWLFATPEDSPGVNSPPALIEGHITFGCLGNFGKINGQVLQLWARVLHAVPEARLLILAGEGRQRDRTHDTLQGLGIAAERVEFTKPCPRQDYFALYQRGDIILDTFPYNGHNTTLDALWMGLPVISLVGDAGVFTRRAKYPLQHRSVRICGTDGRRVCAPCRRVGERSAPIGRTADKHAREDAGLAPNGRPSLRPQH